MFAKFDEILSMILQDIKETKLYGRTVGLSFGRTDIVKTVYPPTNIVCGGYKNMGQLFMMSSPYMKFQNPNFKFFLERMDTRTSSRDGHYVASHHLFTL